MGDRTGSLIAAILLAAPFLSIALISVGSAPDCSPGQTPVTREPGLNPRHYRHVCTDLDKIRDIEFEGQKTVREVAAKNSLTATQLLEGSAYVDKVSCWQVSGGTFEANTYMCEVEKP